MREPLGSGLALTLALTVISSSGCGWTAPSSAQPSAATPSSPTAAPYPLDLRLDPTVPQALPSEGPFPADLLAPLVFDDTAERPLALENGRTGGIYKQPMRPEPVDHVCPSGTAPYAEVRESRAEPAPAYGERPDSYGHRFRVTAAGRVYNGTTGAVSLNPSRPIEVSVDGRGTRLDDVRVSRSISAGGSQSWTASGYYTHYGDATYWRPRLSTAVERWAWSDYRDRDCPR